jgi:hypothetical protein
LSAKDPRAEIVAKALKDPKFREELKKNPAAAIEKAVGVKLPAGVTVRIVEDSASVVHLVLPPSGRPLSEKELGKVAGGLGEGGTHDCTDNTASDPVCTNPANPH